MEFDEAASHGLLIIWAIICKVGEVVPITILAPAKINLSLDVTGRLENGYHTLEMIMQTISLYDEVVLHKAGEGIEIICDNPFVPVGENNICHKAARAFFNRTGFPGGVKIGLSKKIPHGAGLAGGSSDAAAVLKGLNVMYSAGLSTEELLELGLECGADVPFCITEGTCFAEGIGERLTKLPSFAGFSVIVIVPEFAVSTAWVYRNFRMDDCVKRPDSKKLIEAVKNRDINTLAQGMVNVLESVTVVKYPEIEGIKRDIKRNGALGSLMSGSGPSVFGLFESENSAQKAFRVLKNRYRYIYMVSTVDGGKIYG